MAGNQLRDSAMQLALGLQRLRPGLLAELHLNGCGIGGDGMGAVLGALTPGGQPG